MNPATDWIDQARRVLDTLRSAPGEAPGGTADGHSSDCRWCPVCQVAGIVRGERPEVSAALADVLTAAATALRTFAEATKAPPATPDQDRAEDRAQDEDPPPAVQQIDIA